MPGPVVPRPSLPSWADPANRSVFDAPGQGLLRTIVGWLGLDDPNQVMALGAPLETGAQTGGLLDALATKYPRFAKAIKAYHGSPHDFAPEPGAPLGQFSTAKIGTGEGAQAYGHGLYFAEDEGTARSYRNALSAGKFEYQGQPVDPRSSLGRTLDFLRDEVRNGADVKDALPKRVAELRKHAEFMRKAEPNYGSDVMYDSAANQLAALDPAQLKAGGKMYEVGIHADPDHFLDWDAPVDAQSPEVRAAVARAWGLSPEQFAERVAPGARGSALYSRAGHGDPEQAADALRRAGIPGIKYLDQGSRLSGDAAGMVANYGSREQALAAAEQRLQSASLGDLRYWDGIVNQLRTPESRNFVVFDDKTIEILRKYGLLLPAAGLGGAAAASATDSAPAASPAP